MTSVPSVVVPDLTVPGLSGLSVDNKLAFQLGTSILELYRESMIVELGTDIRDQQSTPTLLELIYFLFSVSRGQGSSQSLEWPVLKRLWKLGVFTLWPISI